MKYLVISFPYISENEWLIIPFFINTNVLNVSTSFSVQIYPLLCFYCYFIFQQSHLRKFQFLFCSAQINFQMYMLVIEQLHCYLNNNSCSRRI